MCEIRKKTYTVQSINCAGPKGKKINEDTTLVKEKALPTT